MNKLIPILICILASCVGMDAQETMRVETHRFNSPDFPFEREIFVCTPQYYDEHDQSEIDVIYVFDSQWRSHFALVYGLLAEIQVEGEDNIPFIVVGIPSPTSKDYCRSNDFLPVPTTVEYQSPYYGNYENFKKFIREDVTPYIDANYRTSGHTLAIGHSLGASFVLNALVSEGLFDDYFALSPNFMEDNNKFADDFMNYDFNNGKPRFMFLTMANETFVDTDGRERWRAAWDLVKSHIENTEYPDYIKMFVMEYPDYSHMRSYVECLMDGLPLYGMYRHNTAFANDEVHPVHIELECPWADGDVFITGNQAPLADWNPQGIKMDKVNDTTYSIDLELKLPAEFKFTQGSWEKQITPGNAYVGNLRIHHPDKASKHYVAQ